MELVRDNYGDLAVQVITMPMSEVRITYYDPEGNEVDLSYEYVRSNKFKIEVPGIPDFDPELVKKVIMPDLNYSAVDILYVEIHSYIKKI
jgi:hypothetical protein